MIPVPANKWKVLIDQIKDTEDTKTKIDLLGTMVFMMATNDLACAETERLELKRQVSTMAKKMFIVATGLALLILADVEIKSLIAAIVKWVT